MFQGLSQTLRWEDRQVFSRVGWAMTLLVVLQLAVQVLGLRLAAALAPGLLEAAWFDWVLSAAGSYLVAFPAAYRTLRVLPAVRAGRESPWTPGGLLQGWFMALALIYSANLVTMGLVRLINDLRDTPLSNPVEALLDQPVLFNLLLGCVLAPLAEELLFRKALLDRLKPYGEGFAILASALLFALVHGNLFQMLYAFAVGGFFGYVALRTGGVRWTIPLHAGVNFVSAGLSPLLEYFGDQGESVLSYFILFSLVFGWYLLSVRYRDRDRDGRLDPGAAGMEAGEKWGLFLVNPGMTVFCMLILFVVLLAMRM